MWSTPAQSQSSSRKLKQATEKQQLAEKEAQEKALKEKPKTLVDKDGEWAQWLQGVPLIGQILYGEDGPGSEIAKQVLPNPAYRRTFGDDPFKIPTPEEYKKTNGLADRNKWASDRTQKILDDSVEANKKNPTIAILSATEASDQAQKEYAAATGQEYEAYVELMRKNQGKILFDRDKEAVGDFSALSVVASGAVGFLIGLKSKGGSSAAAATAIGRSVRDSIKKGDAAEVAAGLQRLNAVGPINVSTVLTGNKLAMVAAGGAAHEGVMTIAVLHDYYTGNDERKKNYAKEYVVYWTYTDEKGKTVEKTMHGPWAVIAERFPTTFGTGAFTGLLAGLTTKSVLVLRVPNIAKLENAAAPVLRKSGISVDDVVAPAAPAPTPATAPNVVPFPGSKPAAASTR